ncbi:related to Phosphoribosylamine--glycine ligase [Ramularia collo-cygni]|uniref:phosphoribosylamine--glycine ligase n=1 Tax=Ramularia collo-cygni TaxID=112498 RepID=A0A2D3UW49_9PEZI|nr:related to Phosphoribosylamine--glycine ligase [Ramularia collo-cygni]CZT22012.1 related to Phosphoribosylamine--glycine ligase [Ramularia collo-cygni]
MSSSEEEEPLRILLVGNGGREHTLAWKLAQSPLVEAIHIVPGNGGTANLPKCQNITNVDATDFPRLTEHAIGNRINFLIPGPEAPLVAGITDHFARYAAHVNIFGPSKKAARMEGSKTFSKDFMKKYNIPTARYENFSHYESAQQHLDKVDYNVVIKADGLAGGKGVIIPTSKAEAQEALKDIMQNREFGEAGNSVVIEEFLEGDEISILSLSDGKTILSLPPAQDHKRIGEGDTGPNTGGMGTYAPAPVATKEILEEIERDTLLPTIRGMEKEKMPFVGCLFTGFMLTPAGPRLLEYNVRFGDPETQSCLSLLESDLAELMLAAATGSLDTKTIKVKEASACTVVVAADGYPGSYPKGTVMQVGKPAEGIEFFHAGTNFKNGQLVTSGGRVIASTATGATLKEAVKKAYEGVEQIKFEGMQFRRDIAHRALR